MINPAKCHCGSTVWAQSPDDKRIVCWGCFCPAWQPIETAPKDGTHILVFDGGWIESAWWDDEEKGYGGQCWKRSSNHEFLIPTHWMPLPTPPKKENE